ncbi:hypothetical protein GGF46_005043 [Coemansia sp. RSA 552]|nr:hypothetical protein GGF46_005043 [Coemansia sp. RSA 552]
MPPRRPRNLRKTKRSSDDWHDPADRPSAAGPEASIDPGDLLEFQKIRHRRQRGVDAEVLARGERKRKQAKRSTKDTAGAQPGDAEGDGDGENGAKQPTTRSLNGAFTVQTNKLDANKHMMAFIKNEMDRHRHSDEHDASSRQGGALGALAASESAPADDLYRVPEHLRVIDERPVSEGNVAMAARMLTSIQEVDLGAAAKARNARATDQALTQLSQRADSDREPQSTARFRSSQRSHGAEHPGKASDDAALQRFKKHMRR